MDTSQEYHKSGQQQNSAGNIGGFAARSAAPYAVGKPNKKTVVFLWTVTGRSASTCLSHQPNRFRGQRENERFTIDETSRNPTIYEAVSFCPQWRVKSLAKRLRHSPTHGPIAAFRRHA
jgi:hypothetical protein